MSNDWLSVSLLSDRKLDERLRELAHEERGITAELLAHLAEIDARRLCGGMVEGTTFNYCVRMLKFTGDEACKRIRVARMAREYPVIYDLVARRELGQTAVSRLARCSPGRITASCWKPGGGKTNRELELVLAERFSKPDAPTIIRRLPGRASARVENGVPRSPPAPRAEARTPRASRPGELPTMKAGARADRRSRRWCSTELGSMAQRACMRSAPQPRLERSPSLAQQLTRRGQPDGDTREACATMLAELGAEVRAVPSAASGLAALEDHPPQVILCDVAMPEEDGLGFIQRVKRLDRARGGRVPAAALAALAGDEDRGQALQSGYQMHVAKPVDSAGLVAVVRTLADWK